MTFDDDLIMRVVIVDESVRFPTAVGSVFIGTTVTLATTDKTFVRSRVIMGWNTVVTDRVTTNAAMVGMRVTITAMT